MKRTFLAGPSPQSFKAGRWYGPTGDFSTTTLALVLDRLYLIPLELWRSQPFDGYGIGVTAFGTAGAVLRVGVYADVDGDPGGNPIEEQTISTVTSNGAKTTSFTARSFGPGKLWVAAVAQVATCTTRSISGAVSSRVGSTDPNDLGCFRYKENISGALPAPLTALAGNVSVGPIPVLRAA